MTDNTRTAVVTGGARGIGAAIVTRLRDAGLAVASLDLLDPAGQRAGVLDLRCDIADPDAVATAVEFETDEQAQDEPRREPEAQAV